MDYFVITPAFTRRLHKVKIQDRRSRSRPSNSRHRAYEVGMLTAEVLEFESPTLLKKYAWFRGDLAVSTGGTFVHFIPSPIPFFLHKAHICNK
jgi:hypothetical protein